MFRFFLTAVALFACLACASPGRAQSGDDAVRVTVTMNPDGSKTVYQTDTANRRSTATTTGANGVAVFKYSFNRKKDPTGTYQVRAQASTNGVSGTGSVSFVVK